ncbi:cysteine hydrolase family protein [Bacteriovorax sp. Seq25_V]|uniref:cysteine hydrolase family protein n=1 Tax=Bacteriovorax sp. Seq25_V TaxID=1201288 RepID=UPI000389F584|nr:isochorismatase family cysteine hydrolase [Bacteriovorax sp. Seq25_V]EQC47109.1 isochorismatase family protein [Bacteriovorax sp. Seq25_V]
MEKALIVIDVQTCYLKQKKDQKDVDQLIATVNDTLKNAREKQIPILFVEHEYEGRLIRWMMKKFMGGAGLRESKDFATDPRIDKQNETTMIKTTGDCFQNAEIANWVIEQGAKDVVIVGQDGMYCIKSSIIGALKNSYNVLLVEGGVIAQNQKGWNSFKQKMVASGEVLLTDFKLL